MEIIGGRAVHPQANTVANFNKLPNKEELLLLQTRARESLPDLEATVELFKGFDLPKFSRETEFIALKHPEEFAFIRGNLSSKGC